MKGALFSLGAAAVALSATGLDTAILQARLDAAAASGGDVRLSHLRGGHRSVLADRASAAVGREAQPGDLRLP